MMWAPQEYPSVAAARQAVVDEAMTWLGTPWHHRAKLRGVGVDCGQFPIAVYSAVGLIQNFDTGDYARDHMFHGFGERMVGIVKSLAVEIDKDQVQPGDILLYKFGRVFSHAAMVTSWPQIIHPLTLAGKVVLGDADRDGDLVDKPTRYFSYWVPNGR